MSTEQTAASRPVEGIVTRRFHYGVHELYCTLWRLRVGFGLVSRDAYRDACEARCFAINRERSWKYDRAVCVSVWRFRFGFKVL